jgi:site-specific DNA recombinase
MESDSSVSRGVAMSDGFERDQRGKSLPSRIRCAIYTRKSTEEGLEQDFNSLQAQREAAEAYIKSQKHLGWNLLANHYDDGGFSGGSLDRPALQKLIEDIEGRRVDCVVVYKVDRLSRSLLDFARLIDRFDQHSVSFVSVTQQFNTTTSLGRLTLNILLSFAQFEREIIGERTRDKMSAARKKGKWVGGVPVLGYDIAPGGGRLMLNEIEAPRVREIFDLFRAHLSLTPVVAELRKRGWVNKSWTSRQGIEHIGRPFKKVSLRRLLTNAAYAGKVEYRGTIYEGEQPAIIEASVWQEVNARLRSERRGRGVVRVKQTALLGGLLCCKHCEQPMIPTYTKRRALRFRYYVCKRAQVESYASCPTKSVAADRIETSVVTQLQAALDAEQMRRKLRVPNAEWQSWLAGNTTGLLRGVVTKVSYDGITGDIALQIGTYNAN